MLAGVLAGSVSEPVPDANQPLIDLVTRKFSVPPNTRLNVTELGKTPEFRKVKIFSSTPGHPFEKEFYITADGHFVLEPVGEVGVNPDKAVDVDLRQLAERLKSDNPPRM